MPIPLPLSYKGNKSAAGMMATMISRFALSVVAAAVQTNPKT